MNDKNSKLHQWYLLAKNAHQILEVTISTHLLYVVRCAFSIDEGGVLRIDIAEHTHQVSLLEFLFFNSVLIVQLAMVQNYSKETWASLQKKERVLVR